MEEITHNTDSALKKYVHSSLAPCFDVLGKERQGKAVLRTALCSLASWRYAHTSYEGGFVGVMSKEGGLLELCRRRVGRESFKYKWAFNDCVISGTKYRILDIDGKGRLHLPQSLRKQVGIKNQVVVEEEQEMLVIKPIAAIADPIGFLSSLHIKTRKTPVEMKRESEGVFSS
jgi:bifunctional DNA-binding transcriptional regulator/antitoxin component of YhaV-PrlF toxin-antitoxin module